MTALYPPLYNPDPLDPMHLIKTDHKSPPLPASPALITNSVRRALVTIHATQILNAQNVITGTHTQIENIPLVLAQAAAFAKTFRPLNSSTVLDWITAIYNMPTFHFQFDLPALLRETMHPTNYAGLPSEIKLGIGTTHMDALTQNIQYLCPGDNMLGLFYSEKQNPGEFPKFFIEKKNVLALLSGTIPSPVQGRQFKCDIPDSKTAVLQALNNEMQLVAVNFPPQIMLANMQT